MESIDVEEINRRSKRNRISSTTEVNTGTAATGHKQLFPLRKKPNEAAEGVVRHSGAPFQK